MKTFMFHGPSGVGKDTQVDLLKPYLDMEKINTGDMYRTMPGEGDELAVYWAEKVWKEGLFPSGKVTYELLGRYIKRYNTSKDWVFVSVVRLEDQIAYFEELMKTESRKLDAFIHFTLDEATLVERLTNRSFCTVCNTAYDKIHNPSKEEGVCDRDGANLESRPDDKPDQIKMRLKQYNDSITPILKYFGRNGALIEIDASPSIDVIHKEVVEKLNLTKRK